jgi:hypothetical protein
MWIPMLGREVHLSATTSGDVRVIYENDNRLLFEIPRDATDEQLLKARAAIYRVAQRPTPTLDALRHIADSVGITPLRANWLRSNEAPFCIVDGGAS